MELTKLEIKGFKSFADKVVINFDKGITGIVGPNGCGKSNVVDSIRWVLGEQKTRVLRSEKMDNIIFNGTKARKPTQLAEASLTFSNTKNLLPTEYSSVTITRKYYRSGESEYQLNGVTCRLKDITNLFLDTGIASNSYAIIELKMVDDILSDKDNSRRALFEEAAGISKFKIRKKETLKKLSDTDADLDRVEDLLFEIEKNLKSLERQANQTRKFYEVKEDYKQTSIALAKRSVDAGKQQFDEIHQRIQDENDKKIALSTLVADKEAAIVKAKADLINKEKLLSSRQKTLNEHVSNIRQYESDKKIKNERQKYLQDKIDSLGEQINQDAISIERIQVSLSGLQKEAEEIGVLVEGKARRVEDLKDDYENQKDLTQQANESSTSLQGKYNAAKDHYFQLNKDIEIKEIQLTSLKAELSHSQDETSKHDSSIVEFDAKLTELTEKKTGLETQINGLRAQEEALSDTILERQESIEMVGQQIIKLNRSLDAKRNEYNLTKSLVDNLEGFPEATKFLKKNNKWVASPLLSDLITCPENYRTAIENYLEPFMNHFVVDNQKDAMEAIRLLGDASRGRASFFILDKLVDYKTFTQTTYEGAIAAMEVIEYDQKYHLLFSYLLGNVYLKQDDQPVVIQEDVVMLETSGRATYARFRVSGGSVGLFEGKRIGRVKNLEKLKEEIASLETERKELSSSQEKETALLAELKQTSKVQLIEELSSELNGVNEMVISVQTKRDQFAELITSNQDRRVYIDEQVNEISQQLAELKPQVSKEAEEVTLVEGQLEQVKEELTELQRILEQKSSLFNEENVSYHQSKNKLDSLTQEITFKRETKENAEERTARNKEELQQVSQNLNELIRNSTESDDIIVEMYEEKESLTLGVNEAETAYYEARGLIDEEEKALRETVRQREGIDHALMEWQNKLNEAKMNLNSIKDRLSVEFNIELDKLSSDEVIDDGKLSNEELKHKVDKLRNRIDNMGPINPMAMEAYEEIKERHTFITTQKEDLLNAKESLLTTIGEIDEVAKETFMSAFDAIKENFIKVFRTLFTEEDDCDLSLTDPDRPLESAIEIIAKPKGKRPLTINQLSGGEKTLTATSLLFSIYLLKPAPFCIFDEVDAPLDDANIDKFNQIIRRFSEESQFIIVTHNKRTMSSTDIIYGVTMQEQGVSKVIPVDIRDLQ